MVCSLSNIKELVRSWFRPRQQRTIRPAGVKLKLEFLENRLAPATLADGGTKTLRGSPLEGKKEDLFGNPIPVKPKQGKMF